jgi:hypothetical protein
MMMKLIKEDVLPGDTRIYSTGGHGSRSDVGMINNSMFDLVSNEIYFPVRSLVNDSLTSVMGKIEHEINSN